MKRISKTEIKEMRSQSKKNSIMFAFTLPTVILYTIFFLVTMLIGVYYSFTDWNGISKDYTFVGLKNYVKVLTDERFREALWFNIGYTIALVVLLIVIPLTIAYVMLLSGIECMDNELIVQEKVESMLSYFCTCKHMNITMGVGLNIPLVLHGCSDIPEEQMKEAVNLGMSKFNIATEYFRTMYQSIEKRINNQEFEGNGVKLMYDIKEEMIDFVIQKIRLLNPNKYSM